MPVRLTKKQIIFLGLLITGFFATIVSQTLAATWTGPTATPPGANKEEPINVGTTPQSKEGYLLLRNSGASNNLSLQEIGSGNILSFRVNPAGSGAISNWVLPSAAGSAGQALVVSSVSGNTMNLSWSSSNMPSGSAVGATWYWDGSAWQNNTMIHNNGATGVGIHLQGGAAPISALQLDGTFTPQFNGSSDIGTVALKWRNIYANNFIGTLDPGFTNGSVYFQNGGMTQDNANFFWDNGNKNLGIGTNAPNAKLHVYKTSAGNAEIDIQSTAGSQNHWGIYHDNASDELRFWKGAANRFSFAANGTMTLGTVPWARLASVTSCGGATPVVTGFNSSGPICGPGSSLADPGATGSTIYWNGTAWVGSTNIYNNNGNVGIAVVNPADFKLQVAGDVGPNTNNTYDLGSSAKRWATVYATNINATNISGNINPTGFTAGSVYFQGASGLAQDNAHLFWDDATDRLGIGSNSALNFSLDVTGSVGPHTDNVYNLGSATRRWANLYASNISTTLNGLNLAVPAKAVVFGIGSGAGTLDYDGAFLYDKAASTLTAGHIYPSTNQTFDLGSSGSNWRDLFIKNVKISGFTNGSIAFQGGSGLTQNNNSLFWDDTNRRLGIGTNYPLDTFQVMQGAESNGGWYDFDGASCQMQISGTTATVGVQQLDPCWFTHDLVVGTEIALTSNKGEYRRVVAVLDNSHVVVDRPWTSSGTFAFSYRTRSLAVSRTNGSVSINGGLIDPFYGPVGGTSMFYLGSKLFLHNSGFSDSLAPGHNAGGNNFYFSNLFLGENAGLSFAEYDTISPVDQLNTAIGYSAFKYASGYSYANTALGASALANNSGSYNVAVGVESLFSNTSGSGNVAVGYQGPERVDFYSNSYNTNIGHLAGAISFNNQNNTYIGARAGQDIVGDANVFIGRSAGESLIGNISGALIVNNKNSNQYNSLLYGKFSDAPDNRNGAFLRINGDLQFGYGAGAVKGKTVDAGVGFCINQGPNNLQLFLVKGVLICSQQIAGPNCDGHDFADCCANQAGGC